jgi:hypothetical protein
MNPLEYWTWIVWIPVVKGFWKLPVRSVPAPWQTSFRSNVIPKRFLKDSMDGLHRIQIWPVSRLHLIRFSFDISWIASSMKMLQCKQLSTDFWAPNGCGPIHLQDSSSNYISRIARYFSLNNIGKFSHPLSLWGCVPWGWPFKAQGVLGETKHWEPKSWFTNCGKLRKPVSRQKIQLFVPHIERRSFLCSRHNPCYS